MTKAKAESIIGREVTVEHPTTNAWISSCRHGLNSEGFLSSAASTLPDSLLDLVNLNLRANRALVMARDHYRCTNCKAFGAMHCDHKVARSHGRDDRIENLVTLCRECHGIRHTIPGFHLAKE